MNKFLKPFLMCLLASTNTLQAANLVEVFEQGVQSNPAFLAAGAQLLSEEQNVPISFSFLLPQILGTAVSNWNILDNRSIPLIGASARTNFSSGNVSSGDNFANIGRGTFKFNSHGYEITLSQTLFNWQQWATFQQSKTTVKAANATYAAAAQTLIQQVSSAYLHVLFTEDNLRYIKAEKRAVYRQFDQVMQKYKVGLVPITGVYQAQAEYDTIVAQEIQAKNDIVNAKENLRAITGVYYDDLDGLKEHIPLKMPPPHDVNEWVATATELNWTLQAARYQTESAREEIGIQRAGSYPVFSAQGSYTYAKTGLTPSGVIDTTDTIIGIQMQLPIFQGGLINAQTKQAAFNYKQTLDNQIGVMRSVVKDTHQSYNNINSGIGKIKADRQAIVSNVSSLRSTIEAYRVGTETMLDVLKAQQDLFNAERSYSQDQYDYINAIIALKLAAGTLTAADLVDINHWLTSSKTSYSAIRAKQLEADPLDYQDNDDEPEKGLHVIPMDDVKGYEKPLHSLMKEEKVQEKKAAKKKEQKKDESAI